MKNRLSSNQRLFERVEVRFPARLKAPQASEERDIVVKDFSPEGIKVLSYQRLSLFDRLSLSLTPVEGSAPVSMDGYVVWTGKDSSDNWHAGIKFNQVDLMKANRIIEFCQRSS